MAIIAALFALAAGGVSAQDLSVSGILDSTVNFTAGAGGAENSWGMEEYATIRLQARARDEALFYGSVNVSASSGSYAQAALLTAAPGAAGPSLLTLGDNYAAAMELERLYVKISRETVDFQAGLTRMAFGYGLVFGPMDFMNPRNPLRPNARPRAVLGADLAFYPKDDVKAGVFSAAARDPLVPSGAGTLAGLSGEYHGDRMSVQGLYVYESPHDALTWGVHRFGLSLKGDLVVGLAAEALYTYEPLAGNAVEGLALSLGFDYAFLDGDLYVLAEYLYRGNSAALSLGFTGNHHLYANALYRLDDYTRLGLGSMAALDERSLVLMATAEHELFQGFTLNLTCQVPMDRNRAGAAAGSRVQSTLMARLRF
ncbi:MAG: hypothetical protein LBF95_07495 [Treponema sp.]|nr:hypothetical protein [Treponema sp.]